MAYLSTRIPGIMYVPTSSTPSSGVRRRSGSSKLCPLQYPTSHGRAAVPCPPPPDSSPRCPRRKKGRRRQTRRAGSVERRRPGYGLLAPLEGRGCPGWGGGSNFSEGVLFLSYFVSRPLFWVSVYMKAFFRRCNIIPPPPFFLLSPYCSYSGGYACPSGVFFVRTPR